MPSPLQINAVQPEALNRSSGLVSLGNKVYVDYTGDRILRFRPNKNAIRVSKLRRAVKGAAAGIEAFYQKAGVRYRAAMITLTYAPGKDWEPRHITQLLTHYRNYLKRRGWKMRAVWVCELQARGVPHYHILMWLPRGLTPPKPDNQGWWPHGATNCVWARSAVSYIVKYATKGTDQLDMLERGTRIFGICGYPGSLSWFSAPGWLRGLCSPGDTLKRILGGWWEHPARRWRIRSPWRVLDFHHGEIVLEFVGHCDDDIIYY